LAQYAAIAGADTVLAEVASPTWTWAAPVFAALIVLAYALGPLVPLFRAILDGRRLPERVINQLRRYPQAMQDRARDQMNKAGDYLKDTNVLTLFARSQLSADRARGVTAATADQPALIVAAQTEVDRFLAELNGEPPIASMQAAVDAVGAALRVNSAVLVPILDALITGVLNGLDRVRNNAVALNERRLEIYNKLPPDVQPTEIGNARILSERYSWNAYGVKFEFIWPRVQMVIPENDPSAQRIEAARSLADFAVLTLVLSVLLMAIWLPLLALRGKSTVPFLALGIGGPLFVRFIYQLVVESQISLGEVARGVIDKFRFDVLKLLHIKPPATLSAEREIWAALSAVASGEVQTADIVWDQSPP